MDLEAGNPDNCLVGANGTSSIRRKLPGSNVKKIKNDEEGKQTMRGAKDPGHHLALNTFMLLRRQASSARYLHPLPHLLSLLECLAELKEC